MGGDVTWYIAFVGMQEANLGMCSSSSWYTVESLCGCNTTPYFTPLWVCREVEVFLAFLGKRVPYRAVASYGCTEGVYPSLPNAKGHLQVSSLLLSWPTHWWGAGSSMYAAYCHILPCNQCTPHHVSHTKINQSNAQFTSETCLIITICVDLCTQKLPTRLYYYNYYCYIIHSIYGEHMHNTYLISTVLLITQLCGTYVNTNI